VLPAVVTMLAVVVSTGQVVTAQVRCIDAARAGARLAARGEGGAAVTAAARGLAPPGASVVVGSGGSRVTVTVTADVSLALPVASVGVRGDAVADVESAGGPSW